MPPGSSTFLCFYSVRAPLHAVAARGKQRKGTLLRLCSLHSDNSFTSALLCVICGSRRWWFNSQLFSPVSGDVSGVRHITAINMLISKGRAETSWQEKRKKKRKPFITFSRAAFERNKGTFLCYTPHLNTNSNSWW